MTLLRARNHQPTSSAPTSDSRTSSGEESDGATAVRIVQTPPVSCWSISHPVAERW